MHKNTIRSIKFGDKLSEFYCRLLKLSIKHSKIVIFKLSNAILIRQSFREAMYMLQFCNLRRYLNKVEEFLKINFKFNYWLNKHIVLVMVWLVNFLFYN